MKPLVVEPTLLPVIIQEYEGSIVDDKYEGTGVAYFKGGHVYAGEFKKGFMQGKGMFQWKDGVKYEGDFEWNNIQGRGAYHWPDGSSYEGQVENGLRHGIGVFKCAGIPSRYEGQWVRGRREGLGILYFDQEGKSYYKGSWKEDKKHGLGSMIYASGNVYEGDWSNDAKNGHGCMSWKASNEKYIGTWKNGVQEGYGEHIWYQSDMLDSMAMPFQTPNRYEGEFHQGKRQGHGIFFYATGARYEGNWVENLKEGRGLYRSETGVVHHGPFHQDRLIEQPKEHNEHYAATVNGLIKFDSEDLYEEDPTMAEGGRNQEIAVRAVHTTVVRYNSQMRSLYRSLGRILSPAERELNPSESDRTEPEPAQVSETEPPSPHQPPSSQALGAHPHQPSPPGAVPAAAAAQGAPVPPTSTSPPPPSTGRTSPPKHQQSNTSPARSSVQGTSQLQQQGSPQSHRNLVSSRNGSDSRRTMGASSSTAGLKSAGGRLHSPQNQSNRLNASNSEVSLNEGARRAQQRNSMASVHSTQPPVEKLTVLTKPATMVLRQLWNYARVCKIASGILTLSDIDRIVVDAQGGIPSINGAVDAKDPHNPERVILFREFVLALCHIAIRRYPNIPKPHERISYMFATNVFAYEKNLAAIAAQGPNAIMFESFPAPVEALLRKYSEQLRMIYAENCTARGAYDRTMQIKDLLRLCKEHKIIDDDPPPPPPPAPVVPVSSLPTPDELHLQNIGHQSSVPTLHAPGPGLPHKRSVSPANEKDVKGGKKGAKDDKDKGGPKGKGPKDAKEDPTHKGAKGPSGPAPQGANQNLNPGRGLAPGQMGHPHQEPALPEEPVEPPPPPPPPEPPKPRFLLKNTVDLISEHYATLNAPAPPQSVEDVLFIEILYPEFIELLVRISQVFLLEAGNEKSQEDKVSKILRMLFENEPKEDKPSEADQNERPKVPIFIQGPVTPYSSQVGPL